MMTTKKYRKDRLIVQSALPILTLLDLEILQKMNDHGRLRMNLSISEEEQEAFLRHSFEEENVQILDDAEQSPVLLFNGKVERVVTEMSDHALTACVHCISYTIELDGTKKSRSFQNPSMTYDSLVKALLGNSHYFIWNADDSRTINAPIVQYEETDWQFLMRIASHFHTKLYPIMTVHKPAFALGMSKSSERKINEDEVLQFAFSNDYFELGGHTRDEYKTDYCFLRIEHDTAWEMGDYVSYRQHTFLVYEHKILFKKGRLYFSDTLGTKGMFFQNKMYNPLLKGLKLKGIIRRAVQESVYIQLDIDQEEESGYPWPWVPEIGNLCYCMPEPGSEVMVSFSDSHEETGLAVGLLRSNNNAYQTVQHREFKTMHRKKIGMYPDELLLEGKSGLTRLSMADRDGIHFDSQTDFSIQAQGDILFQGQDVSVTAPQKITLCTSQSNIELCKNFNFFAPGKVKTTVLGGKDIKSKEKAYMPQTDVPEPWQLSYAAMGAIPSVDLTGADEDGVVALASAGAVPQLAKGPTVIAMSEIMDGKKLEDTSFKEAFSSIGTFTMKGGYPVQKEG